MKIDVWSDIACPYCCIGGIRLKKALRELDCEELFEIVPRSFQLEPELAGPGRPALRHYADKMGVEIEDLQEGLDRIVALAAGEGLEFCFDRVLAANTFDAHRLVKHAQALGVPNMTERLFEACFRDGLDVGDHAVLAGLAADAGLDPEHARAMLASDAWTAEVVADMAEARARGIRLVPHYVLEGGRQISGAQTVAYFKEILQKAIQEQARAEFSQAEGHNSTPPSGEACGPGGCAWR